jgi:hypothetical protein
MVMSSLSKFVGIHGKTLPKYCTLMGAFFWHFLHIIDKAHIVT